MLNVRLLYFGNNWLKRTKVSATGAFTIYFNVPSYAKVGAYYDVIVRDEYDQELARARFLVGARIVLDSEEGEIGDWVRVNGYFFGQGREVSIYFSSHEAAIGNNLGNEVTAYE